MNPELSRTRGLLAVLTASTAFSWGFVLAKMVGLPPPTIAFVRLWLGGFALLAVALAIHAPRPKHLGSLIAAGVFFAMNQVLYIYASVHTSIAIVTLISALQPLLVGILSPWAVDERPAKSLLFWALVAVVGVAIVVWANQDHASQSLLGNLLSVANLLAFTAYFLFTKRARNEGTHTIFVTAGPVLVAALLITPTLLLEGNYEEPSTKQLGLILLILLGPSNGHLLVNWAHRHISAALSSLVLTAVPLLASLWAFWVFDEPYGPWQILGTLVVALAVEAGRRAEWSRLSVPVAGSRD